MAARDFIRDALNETQKGDKSDGGDFASTRAPLRSAYTAKLICVSDDYR